MSVKTFKQLPLGNEDFVSLREKGYYYVDKTSYLKAVFTDSSSILLFTRPRRFGKTLLMDMFAAFLTIAEDGSTGRERKEKLLQVLRYWRIRILLIIPGTFPGYFHFTEKCFQKKFHKSIRSSKKK